MDSSRALRMICRGYVAAGAAALALLAGCSTPGPLHIYTLPTANAGTISDLGPEAKDVSSFVASGETIVGFAYDPFTDHFFLRLPNRIRVVDRPARAIKREFDLPSSAGTGGDLAVRPKTGHLYLVHAAAPRLIELTRLGEFVREISLPGLTGGARGVACDQLRDRLLVLESDVSVSVRDLDGHPTARITLAQPVRPCLGYDSDRREIYAPLTGDPAHLGVFAENGQLLRTLTQPAAFLDVGPRSFLRMF